MLSQMRAEQFYKIAMSVVLISFLSSCGSSSKPKQETPKAAAADMTMNIDDTAPAPVTTPPPADPNATKMDMGKPVTKTDAPKVTGINFGALAKSNRFDQLKDEATKALIVNANDVGALNALAFSYYKKNQLGAARIVLERANERNPNTPQILTNLAILDMADNESARALNNLKKSYKIDDHNAETLALIGSIYIQNRDYAKALMPLEQSYKADKTNIRVANNYAVALTKTKSYEAAQKIYDEIMVQNARDSEVLLNYAGLLVDYLNKPKEGLNLVYKVKFIETERQDIIEMANKIETRAKSALK